MLEVEATVSRAGPTGIPDLQEESSWSTKRVIVHKQTY
jgi:hypothetical protein